MAQGCCEIQQTEEKGDLVNMNIIHYFESEDKAALAAKIAACD